MCSTCHMTHINIAYLVIFGLPHLVLNTRVHACKFDMDGAVYKTLKFGHINLKLYSCVP